MSSITLLASQHEVKGNFKKAAELYLEYAEKEYKDAGKDEKNKSHYLGYKWAAEGFKASAFSFRKLGNLKTAREIFRKAIDAYEKSITSFALDEDTYTAPGIEFYVNWTRKRIADIYMELNEKEKARKIYKAVIDFLNIKLKSYERDAPKNELWFGDVGVYCEMLAMLYQKLGEYEKALEYCDKAGKYLEKSEQGALIQINELDYYYFANDFVEELVTQEIENGTLYFEDNPEIFGKLKGFKHRINLRRKLIKKSMQESHS